MKMKAKTGAFGVPHIAIAFAVLCSGAVNAQTAPMATPPSTPVFPDPDNRYWVLLEDMRYRIGDTQDHIVVPAGFVTDYASIPQAMWSFGLGPHGRYSRAALVHDYLYWSQGCTKDQADNLLVIAMKESHVDSFDEMAIFAGVKVGGQPSWDSNAKELQSGMPRVVPERKRRIPSDVTWPNYRVELAKSGVRDPSFPKSPPYCVYGNSRNVPGMATSKLFAQSRIVPMGGKPAGEGQLPVE